MSDNLMIVTIILLALSTCGKPDLWDASIAYIKGEKANDKRD